MDHPGHRVNKGRKVIRVYRVPWDPLVHKAHKGSKVYLARWDHRVQL